MFITESPTRSRLRPAARWATLDIASARGGDQVEAVSRSLLRRWLTALVVVAIGLSTLATTRSAYAEENSTVEMKRTKVKAAELSVAIPSNWVRISLTDDDLESLGEAFDEANPEVGESIGELNESAIKLHAQDPLDGDSVSVTTGPGALIGGKKLVKAVLEAQLAGVPGFELVRVRDMKSWNGRGVRADYRYELFLSEDESLPIYEVGVFLPLDDGEIAHVDIAVDDEPTDIAMADKIVRSLRPL